MVISGGTIVLFDRTIENGSIVIEDGLISAIESRRVGGADLEIGDALIVPGFVDVHVHGVEGMDALDGGDVVERLAARFPRYGVTAFCPTTVACPPRELRTLFDSIHAVRESPRRGAARVVGAHLESNFINPDFRGAQPLTCIRPLPGEPPRGASDFSGDDIAAEIERGGDAVAIVTLAPELPGALEYTRRLVASGRRVSLGHSGATHEQGAEGIAAGARHATHLFNRMPPLSHRGPGLAGAVLASGEIAAELISDGAHVHPLMMQVAIRAKGLDRICAITDGTAGSGLPVGSRARLGSHSITVGSKTALLDDGTIAGSVLTMNNAFRLLVEELRLPVVEAARLCATTPARELRLATLGEIRPGFAADLVVLDRRFQVTHTFVGGQSASS